MIAADRQPLGLVKDMPFADYLAFDAVSSSALKVMARSPWHYRNRVEIEQTRPMLRGSLAHCAVLEPAALQQRYVVVPDDAPKRPTKAQWAAKKPNESSIAAMAWWTEFGERCAGKEIVTAAEYAVTQMQIAAIRASALLSELFAEGYSECSVFWFDDETGLMCKARPDFVRPIDDKRVVLVDLKSTMDESPTGFGRTSARMKYEIQQAHYIAGFEEATGMIVEDFIFTAVSSAPPVLAVPYRLTDEIAAQGFDERREMLTQLAACKKADEWPAYGSGILPLDYPAYAKRSTEVEISYAED